MCIYASQTIFTFGINVCSARVHTQINVMLVIQMSWYSTNLSVVGRRHLVLYTRLPINRYKLIFVSR